MYENLEFGLAEQRQKDMRRQAERDRQVRRALETRNGRPRLYRRLLTWLAHLVN